ncbi:hypothetical protein G7A72_03930 [Flavobacterium sp. Sr18]|uniref:zinc ribbon domain-containing protein n=1 Tax=Flavobacterium sp. Sr18 TaxID=935222 RepID=UPI0013E4CE33|nr:zinc ribbon domain-containing protein [Flavobacterium sp. Sr18]QIH37997.1 hypothetical protein G7A72_03930 [Flavobacterium sp. Sr18]
MENTHFCQSCGMPLTTEDAKGTENNGLKTNDYCRYCYEDSRFKNPDMNLEEMKNTVKMHMEKKKLPIYMVQKALNILPALQRWKNKQFVI